MSEQRIQKRKMPLHKNEQTDLISLAEAGQISGYHQDYLGALCRTGKLAGKKIGRNWVVSKKALHEFMETGKKTEHAVEDAITGQGSTPVEASASASSPSSEIEHKLSLLSHTLQTHKLDAKLHALEGLVDALARKVEVRDYVSVNPQKSLMPVEVVMRPVPREEKPVAPAHTKFLSAFDFGSSAQGSDTLPINEDVHVPQRSGQSRKLFTSSVVKLVAVVGTVTLCLLLGALEYNKSPVTNVSSIFHTQTRNTAQNPTSGIVAAAEDFTAPGVGALATRVAGVQSEVKSNAYTTEPVTSLTVRDLDRLVLDTLQNVIDNGWLQTNFSGASNNNVAPTPSPATGSANGGSSYVPIFYYPSVGPTNSGTSFSATTLSATDFITDNAHVKNNLVVDGTISGIFAGTINLGLTAGSVPFQTANGLGQDNANFFWDDAANSLGIGTASVNASAVLQLDSTQKGFLAPRMTTTERDAIAAPATGLLVYNTTTNQFNVYNGTIWTSLGGGGGSSVWSSLTDPSANLAISMGTNTSTFGWATGSGANNLFSLTTANASNGTGYLANIATGTGSTVKPLRIAAGVTDALTIDASAKSVFGGKATFAASTTGASSVNIPSGVAPTVPVTGDFWNQSGSLKFYDGSTSQALTYVGDLASTADPAKGDALIGFKQTGTGGVARTVHDKLNEVTSVTDFGAVGDGSTNNAAALQAAINNGGQVVIPEGVFNFGTTLTLKKDTTIIGKGKSSVLRFTGSGAALREPVGSYTGGYDNLKLKDFTLTTNSVASTKGIELTDNYQVTIDGVYIDGNNQTGFTTAGIHILSSSISQNSAIIRITNGEIWLVGGDAIRTSGPGGVAAVWIEHMHLTGAGGWGVNESIPAPPFPQSNLQINNNVIEGNVAGGVNIDNAQATTISGNYFENINGSTATLVRLSSAGAPRGIEIKHNVFGGKAADYLITLLSPSGVTGEISNNTFSSANIAAINATDTRGVSIFNNFNDGSIPSMVAVGTVAQSLFIQDGNGVQLTAGATAPQPTLSVSGSIIAPLFTNAGDVTLGTSSGNGNIILDANGTGSVRVPTAVTTGTFLNAGLSVTASSLTSGQGVSVFSTSLTSGSLVDLTVAGTAASGNTQTVLNVATSGTNSTSGQLTYAAQISNTHTGPNATNIGLYTNGSGGINNYGLYATASGGTNNFAAVFEQGNVGIGTISPTLGALQINKDSTYSSENAGALYIRSGSADSSLILGSDATNDISYIQSMQNGTSFTSRALVLQPNGGNVGIGTTSATTFGLEVAGNIGPSADNVRDIGSLAKRYANVYAANFVGNITLAGFTQGSVIFAGSAGALAQNNSNFFWDDADVRLSIGSTNPDAALSVKTSGQNAVVNIYGLSSGTDYGVIQVSSTGTLNNPSTRPLVLQPNAGNVGIGDSSPAALLTVGNGDLFQVASSGAVTIAPTGTGSVFINSGVTNGSGSSAGLGIANTALSSGTLVSLSSNSTAAAGNTQQVLGVSTTGQNATDGQLTYGASIANTHTPPVAGTATNIALALSASGGSANYALFAATGNNYFGGSVGIGVVSPSYPLDVAGTSSTGISYTNAAGHALIRVDGADASQAGYYIYKAGVEKVQLAVMGSSNNLTFNMAGSPKMTLTSSGSLAVGAAAPVSLLDIQQAANSAVTATPVGLQVGSTGGGLTAASGTQKFASITPVINQSGTAGYTALLVNTTETATGSGGHFLLDLQAGGASKFSVQSDGTVILASTVYSGNDFYAASTGYFGFGSRSKIASPIDGQLQLLNSGANNFTSLLFGPSTSSFPAIKRSGTGLAMRLADDSADAALSAGATALSGTLTFSGVTTDITTGSNESLIVAPNGSGSVIISSSVTSGSGSGSGLFATSTTLTSGALVTFSTTSTGAAANTQQVLNVTASGANVTAGQLTYGASITNAHTGAGVNIALDLESTGGAANYALYAGTGTSYFGGNVGLGTPTPDGNAHLTVVDPSFTTLPTSVPTIITVGSSDGTTGGSSIRARGTITGGLSDVGEYAKVEGQVQDYEQGDVLSVSTTQVETFAKSTKAYDTKLATVVTTTAGLLAGGGDDSITYDASGRPTNRVMIALGGRVPVKVSLENGPIRAGDFLTASGTKFGYAMKAIRPGQVIGQALEPYDSQIESEKLRVDSSTAPKILIYIAPQFWVPSVASLMQDQNQTLIDSQDMSSLNLTNASVFGELVVTGSVYIQKDLVVKGVVTAASIRTDKLYTKELCLEDVCLTKDELRQLLNVLHSGREASTPVQSPAVTPPPAEDEEVVPMKAEETPEGLLPDAVSSH